MEFESLIFDIDGTLWDSRAMVAEGYNIQLRAEGLGHLCLKAEDLTPLFGKVKEDLANALFAMLPEEARNALMNRCMDSEREYMADMDCAIGYPNVKETLEKLSEKYRLFIVSNCDCGYPELCMEKLGIGHLIEGHLCYGDTGTPKGQTIAKLMADHRISSACYIGDTQGDADASKAAGIPFVYCTYGFGNVDGFWKSIDCFADLLELF